MTNNNDALKYYERLNIPCLTIAEVKNLIKMDIVGTLKAWNSDPAIDVCKQCFHIIGPSGVGKTEICKQIPAELTQELGIPFELIMVKAPVLSRDDFIIPFPIIDNSNTSFKMLYSDFIPKVKDSYGIFVIDEFSRGDHSLQQLLWQIQNEYSIHRYDFPKGWFVISLDNPDDQEYAMDILEDAAGLRRQLHIYTDVSSADFLRYAISKNFHKHVIEYIQAHPDRLYDFASQKLGSVFANPASYEKLSNILWKFENSKKGIDGNLDNIENLAGGLLNTNMANLFIEFMIEDKSIKPADIVNSYSTVQPKVQALVNNGDNVSVVLIMEAFIAYLVSDMPSMNQEKLKNIAGFLIDIPLDVAATFLMMVEKLDKSKAEFKYIVTIHTSLMSFPDYISRFYVPVLNNSNQAMNTK